MSWRKELVKAERAHKRWLKEIKNDNGAVCDTPKKQEKRHEGLRKTDKPPKGWEGAVGRYTDQGDLIWTLEKTVMGRKVRASCTIYPTEVERCGDVYWAEGAKWRCAGPI